MRRDDTLTADGLEIGFVRITPAIARAGRDVNDLPFACRILVENLERSRRAGQGGAGDDDVAAMIHWERNIGAGVPLRVGRVILPDSSGLPVLLDLAALRDAVARAGRSPEAVEPRVPVDVIVDHSLQVDVSATPDAMTANMQREFERNGERYRFLKWAQQAFKSVRVFPPGTGIIHQVNLEHIATVVMRTEGPSGAVAYPDFVIGGDSHTPMINGIGVLGWGVGGIEAEAAMLGQPYVFSVPEFVGVRLEGVLPPGATTTDLVLHVTERLRREQVVAAVVEYVGPGVDLLPVPERATLANMAPEYGATAGYFPIDDATIAYLALTRTPEHAAFVKAYAVANDLFRLPAARQPAYSRLIEIDLARVTRSVAGPRRPQDRLDLPAVAADFRGKLAQPMAEGGFAAAPGQTTEIETPRGPVRIGHGSLAIAAITACTNTSNPAVMIAAGLVARNAVAAGLSVPSWVKTSLAPGSRVVTRYLADLGLLAPLEALGFGVVGYGCTTCSGKSGPLLPAMAAAIDRSDLVATAALSGNRNFEGRIHRQIRANYIMSPPLVVAFALAGRIDIDLEREPLGTGLDGRPVRLADLWPQPGEIAALIGRAGEPRLFKDVYAGSPSSAMWDDLEAPTGTLFPWDPHSTYLLEPPFLALAQERARTGLPSRIAGARVLGLYGDSLTTDHISPSGEIPLDSQAGQYLIGLGVRQSAFNTYVGRRCNHEVMARATFANLRIKNLLTPGREGGWTRLLPEGDIVSVYEAASTYQSRGIPAIVLGGKDYGMGSSRDWAAKGSALLGVRAVIAESYERIHRSNLIGMGVVPLRFAAGEGWRQLGLDGAEEFTIEGLADAVDGMAPATVVARGARGSKTFPVSADVSTRSERTCLRSGGLMAEVLASFTGPAAGRTPSS